MPDIVAIRIWGRESHGWREITSVDGRVAELALGDRPGMEIGAEASSHGSLERR